MIGIRPGSFDDLELVGDLHTRIRQHAYQGILAQEVLDAMDPSETAQRWREIYQAQHRFFLAYADGVPIGLCYTDEDLLRAIHVLPEFHGKGAGPVLMQTARKAMQDLGFRTSKLWVVDNNARARRFYERDGWTPSGLTREKAISGGMTTQLEYVCEL